jgi:hypothetical protein
MGDVESQRTLVKSAPELWAELSETPLLGRMLAEPFGEIRITRREPESSLHWESEHAVGSVELLPSGFGTRVRLTAQIADSDPTPGASSSPAPTPGFLARLLGRWRAQSAAAEAPAPEPIARLDEQAAQRALIAVLDEIGTARHRPFSRHPGAGAH